MPTTKNILIIAALLFGGVAVFGYKKVNQLKSIFDKMTLMPTKIHSVDFNWTRGLRFVMDLTIKNPTNQDFYATGLGMADLTRVEINYKGQYLATADLKGINQLEIAAQDSMTITGIEVNVPAMALLPFASTFTANNFMNDIKITGIVTAFGSEYEIEN